jgi:hypothetical protein
MLKLFQRLSVPCSSHFWAERLAQYVSHSWNLSRYVGKAHNAAKPCKPKLKVPISPYLAVKNSVIRTENTERKKNCANYEYISFLPYQRYV